MDGKFHPESNPYRPEPTEEQRKLQNLFWGAMTAADHSCELVEGETQPAAASDSGLPITLRQGKVLSREQTLAAYGTKNTPGDEKHMAATAPAVFRPVFLRTMRGVAGITAREGLRDVWSWLTSIGPVYALPLHVLTGGVRKVGRGAGRYVKYTWMLWRKTPT